MPVDLKRQKHYCLRAGCIFSSSERSRFIDFTYAKKMVDKPPWTRNRYREWYLRFSYNPLITIPSQFYTQIVIPKPDRVSVFGVITKPEVKLFKKIDLANIEMSVSTIFQLYLLDERFLHAVVTLRNF